MTSIPLPPLRFLVCAGSTREPLDQVRDWGNIFTGGTGFDIARALSAYGTVDLLTSNHEHLALIAAGGLGNHPMQGFGFRSHADLRAGIEARYRTGAYDGICMSAAVSDYTPAGCYAVISRTPVAAAAGTELWNVRDVQAGKVSSQHQTLAVLGRQTEKLVDLFRAWGHRGVLVKFKLEVGLDTAALLAIGERSRQSSGADVLIANTLEMVAGPQPGAWMLGAGEPRWLARTVLAAEIAAEVARRLGRDTAAAEAAPVVAQQLAEHCRRLAVAIGALTPAEFANRALNDGRTGASIGEHVRHYLDHLHAILASSVDGRVDYEQRRRGWAGESEPALALAELDTVVTTLSRVRAPELLRVVQVRCSINPEVATIIVPSTFGRELLFGLSHEIHHAALIAARLASSQA